MTATEEEAKGHEARFLALISGLSSTVMQHLGKVINPMTGKIERNLEAAKEIIDMLRMLREKTRGNLSNFEERTLNALLSSVQLNYLDELKAEAEKPKEKPAEKPAEEKKEEPEGREEEAAPAGPEKKAEAAEEKEEVTPAQAGAEPKGEQTPADNKKSAEQKTGRPRKAKKAKGHHSEK
jgi:hypothetical protein